MSTLTDLWNPWLRRAVLLSLAIFLGVTGVRFVRSVLRSADGTGHGTALSDYLRAGDGVDSEPLYDANFSYPPIFAVGMEPLAELPLGVAATVWFLFQVGVLGATAYFALRLLRAAAVPHAELVLWIALIASSRFLLNNLTHGNVNSLVLMLVLASADWLGRGALARAGLAISAAASIKLLPLIFLPMLAARRAWRSVAGLAVGLLVCNALLPALWLGAERAIELSVAWYEKMIEPFYQASAVSTDERNLALAAAIDRHFTDGTMEHFDPTPTPLHVDLLTPASANFVTKVLLGGIVICVLTLSFRARRDRSPRRFLVEAALALLTMLLISPKTWKAHFVWILPAYLVLISKIIEEWQIRTASARATRFGLAAIIVAGAASSRGIVGLQASEWLHDLSIETLVVLGLWVLIAREGWRSVEPNVASNEHRLMMEPRPIS
ncbi:MAG: DUF2029 domain-containing protein [Planctomycetes bacterium]|nr:DUF2029 domain-containing protein [Planctomycetota bacterium]